MRLKNGKKLYNERGITFFLETERYVNNLNIYNRSKTGTNLWDDLINNVELRFAREKFLEIRTSSISHHLCYRCKLCFAYTFLKFVQIIIRIIILLLRSLLNEKFISIIIN